MRANTPVQIKNHNFPRWLPILAVVAACLSGFAGFLVFGLNSLIAGPIILILGAVIQPYAPQIGRWILAAGALLTSAYVIFFIAPQALGAILLAPQYHTPHDLGLLLLFVMSIVLVAWLDVALVKNRK